MTAVLINPGTGPNEGDICREHAIANIEAFMAELGLPPPVVSVTMASPKHDGAGWYQFVLHRGIRKVDVDMPGLPLGEIRCDADLKNLPRGAPRLYVDGNSWWWGIAVGFARDALVDHDGEIQRRVEAAEKRCDRELDERPLCEVCGGVRSVIVDGNEMRSIECLTCVPRFITHYEDGSGAVFLDGSEDLKTRSHYVVEYQYMPPETPGIRLENFCSWMRGVRHVQDNPMHPDAGCRGAVHRGGGQDSCRLRARHHPRKCDGFLKEVSRKFVVPASPGANR